MLLSSLTPSANGQVPWAADLAALSSVGGEIKDRTNNPMETSVEDNRFLQLEKWRWGTCHLQLTFTL